ncbi:MAG: hypothetical protein AAB821_03555, partial [Patescibacteria group bacterium]
MASDKWEPNGHIQQNQLLFLFDRAKIDLEKVPEIASFSSGDVEAVNRFLEEQGFHVQLPPRSPGRPGFAIATRLNVLVKWFESGMITTLCVEKYPAVRIGSGVKFYHSSTPNPICVIETKSLDRVYMTVWNDSPSGFDLLTAVLAVKKNLSETDQYRGVVFPMITRDKEENVSWMKGLATNTGVSLEVNAAVQQTRFWMNQVGARVDSAAAVSFVLLCGRGPIPKPDLIIDQP